MLDLQVEMSRWTTRVTRGLKAPRRARPEPVIDLISASPRCCYVAASLGVPIGSRPAVFTLVRHSPPRLVVKTGARKTGRALASRTGSLV